MLLGLLSLLKRYICTSPPSFSQAANTSNSLIIVNLAATPVFKLLSSADYNGIVVDFPFLYCWYPAFCWDDCLQATAVTFSHSMTFFSFFFFLMQVVKIVISLLCVADLGQLQLLCKTTERICEYRYFSVISHFRSQVKAHYTEHLSLERHASHHHHIRILLSYSAFLPTCIFCKETFGTFIFILVWRK